MAASFFALLDDIAILMDDVAVMGKVAAKKTAGLLADDLAVNAEKASGFNSSRELPVLWKITKGSLLNKVIILPIAMLLSSFFPQAITALLLLGGLYLGFEGVEKVYHYAFHRKELKAGRKLTKMTSEESKNLEAKKIKSAIFIDFILSAEIVIIALSTVINEPLKVQIPIVSAIALVATVGVYGLVALLVRMDDFGLSLIAASGGKKGFLQSTGLALVNILPFLIRALTILGTFAMVLVAGGIYVHNLHFVHELIHKLPSFIGELVVGLVVGIVALIIFKLVMKLVGKNH